MSRVLGRDQKTVYVHVFRDKVGECRGRVLHVYHFLVESPNRYINGECGDYNSPEEMLVALKSAVRKAGEGGWPAERIILFGTRGHNGSLHPVIEEVFPDAVPLSREEFDIVLEALEALRVPETFLPQHSRLFR